MYQHPKYLLLRKFHLFIFFSSRVIIGVQICSFVLLHIWVNDYLLLLISDQKVYCHFLLLNWKVLHKRELRVIRISPFANRLSFDAPPAVQRLRCLANYEALRFSTPIYTLGETLVARMKERSANNSGKYISVHLRFEEVCFY